MKFFLKFRLVPHLFLESALESVSFGFESAALALFPAALAPGYVSWARG